MFDKFEGADFKHDNSFLKIRHFLNKAFLVPTLGIFIFGGKILQLYQFNGADFKYDNIFVNSYPKIPKEGIFVSRFRHFIFSQKFGDQANSRMLISNMRILLSNSSPKIPKLGIFGLKFKDFQFCTKFCNKAYSKTLISDMTIHFSNCSRKILK